MKAHLLFICSGDKDRSPTAVGLFKGSKRYLAKSAGTHSDAIRVVDQKLVDWADIIFVMSEGTNKHRTFLKKHFDLRGKRIHDLKIRDMYDKNNVRLIGLLRKRISKLINVL
jgi:predicted protein tyrosine phosphatase